MLSAMPCPYCMETARLVDGITIYPHRPDLREKNFYQCAPCDAYVGCHPGTSNPLGRLASAELRAARRDAHTAFDHIWKSGGMKRRDAYAWLSGALGIDENKCHIGMFDVADCRLVIEVCKRKGQCTGTERPTSLGSRKSLPLSVRRHEG
jgi:hypothetical protein